MSEIDGYRHHCIGIVRCPSRFALVPGQSHRDVALYRLDQDALDAVSFRAKRGDLLLGGGSGESAALRIAIPEAFSLFTHPDWGDFNSVTDIVQAYWTMTDAFIFGDGYRQVGWHPDEQIEHWLAKHILTYLVLTFPHAYQHLVGSEQPPEDGAIVRRPRGDERTL